MLRRDHVPKSVGVAAGRVGMSELPGMLSAGPDTGGW